MIKPQQHTKKQPLAGRHTRGCKKLPFAARLHTMIFHNLNIRTQFALLLLAAGTFSFLLFGGLWLHKWAIGRWLFQEDVLHTQLQDTNFFLLLEEEAKNYDLPSSEKNLGDAGALEEFFDLADEYTSVYLYDAQDGMFRAGRIAPVMDETKNGLHHNPFFSLGYRLTDGSGEDLQTFPLHFRNGLAFVMLYNYQRSLFVYPYLLACLFLSALAFFVIMLFFIRRKMKSVLVLEQEVLTMSTGDLTHPVPDFGGDEIGTLARELDGLRSSLQEHITREEESRRANQDLITALSHDLRTPLTILTGYLEVLRLKRNPGTQEKYLERCLKKTEDLKELTDRMFEYALVYEENETPKFSWISTDFIRQCLQDNCDYIRLAGFTPCFLSSISENMPLSADFSRSSTGNHEKTAAADTACVLESDPTMLKRIFNNLFSNILKYGDKKAPVEVVMECLCSASGESKKPMLFISVTNRIKQEHAQTDSNNIGLKSVQKMTRLLHGKTDIKKENSIFTVLLLFPLR